MCSCLLHTLQKIKRGFTKLGTLSAWVVFQVYKSSEEIRADCLRQSSCVWEFQCFILDCTLQPLHFVLQSLLIWTLQPQSSLVRVFKHSPKSIVLHKDWIAIRSSLWLFSHRLNYNWILDLAISHMDLICNQIVTLAISHMDMNCIQIITLVILSLQWNTRIWQSRLSSSTGIRKWEAEGIFPRRKETSKHQRPMKKKKQTLLQFTMCSVGWKLNQHVSARAHHPNTGRCIMISCQVQKKKEWVRRLITGNSDLGSHQLVGKKKFSDMLNVRQ